MALTKSLSRLDAPTLQTLGEGTEREALLALSQRKLNALGMPVCYIDADQHYRFVNRAFLDWSGRSAGEVIGREIVEVEGRELYQLYHAYVEAALSGERVSFERQLSAPSATRSGSASITTPIGGRAGKSAACSPPTPTSTTSSGSSSRLARANTACALSPIASPFQSSISTAHCACASPTSPTETTSVPLSTICSGSRCRISWRRMRSPRCKATSSVRSPARPSATTAASARHPGNCAGCASRSSPTVNRGGASAARSSSSTTSRTMCASVRRSRRRRRSCGCSPTTSRVRSPISTSRCATRSSTRPLPTGSAGRRTRSTARHPMR